MRTVGTLTKHYRCVECGKACDEMPLVVNQDQEGYKRGIVEGLKMAIDVIYRQYNPCDYTERFADGATSEIEELIKQHEGK